MEKSVENIVDDLEKNGSNIPYKNELINNVNNYISKDKDLEDIMKDVSRNLEEQAYEFLNMKNQYGIRLITGISSNIYIKSKDENNDVNISYINGKASRNNDRNIDENTLFDLASITKLFTLLLCYRLEALGYIHLDDKIVDDNPDFPGLGAFTYNDLIRLHGVLKTKNIIKMANNEEEAYEALKTVYLESDTRKENKYTDLGAIILSKTIERIMSKELEQNIDYNTIMKEFLLKPLRLYNTTFNPESKNLSGNGNEKGLVHDSKSRILGGQVGSAGLFSNGIDLIKLANFIFMDRKLRGLIIPNKYLDRLGEITFPNSRQSVKGNLGVYVKHHKGFEEGYTPNEYSTGSFSHQGWTGQVATFDPTNMVHQNILVNTVYKSKDKSSINNDKPIGFKEGLLKFSRGITEDTMILLVAKRFYELINNEKLEENHNGLRM